MTLPVEDWNAQISLMTGMAAAKLMLEGGVGILRTMPAPDAERSSASAARSRRSARPGPRTSPTASTSAASIPTIRKTSR